LISGNTYNVFADDAFMQGSIRYYDLATLEVLKKRLYEIVENTGLAFGCKTELEWVPFYPPVINHEK